MAAQSFTASVEAWVARTKQRMEKVVKNSAESVVEEMILRTPVDTGWLSATLVATLGTPAAIDPNSRPPKGADKKNFGKPAYALVIHGAQLGETISVTFTAAYARHVEYGTKHQSPAAMVRLSAQNWPFHVAQAVRDVKAADQVRSPGSARPSG